MKQIRGFKYRFYPTSAQRLELAQTFGCTRFVYNWALSLRTNSYYQNNVSLSYTDTSNALTKLKKDPDKPWLKAVSSVPLQQGLRHLNTAFKNFFAGKTEYPKFKKKNNRQSAHYAPNAFTWRDGKLTEEDAETRRHGDAERNLSPPRSYRSQADLDQGKKNRCGKPRDLSRCFSHSSFKLLSLGRRFSPLRGSPFRVRSQAAGLTLAKMSEPLKIRWSRYFKGEPKQVIVSKDPSNRYFVSFLVEEELEQWKLGTEKIGIDLGIKDIVVSSTGFASGNPKHYQKYQARLKTLQRRLARKKKGSNNRYKARRTYSC